MLSLRSCRREANHHSALAFNTLSSPVGEAGRRSLNQHRIVAHDLSAQLFGRSHCLLSAVPGLRRPRHANLIFHLIYSITSSPASGILTLTANSSWIFCFSGVIWSSSPCTKNTSFKFALIGATQLRSAG